MRASFSSDRQFPLTVANGPLSFRPGDLTSATTFSRGEVYPVLVVAGDQLKKTSPSGRQSAPSSTPRDSSTTLFSSSGRLTYSPSQFLRFIHANFAPEATEFDAFSDTGSQQQAELRLALQNELRGFSRHVTGLLAAHRGELETGAQTLLRERGLLYEEDLVTAVFGSDSLADPVRRFVAHKFLFEEGDAWIKDSQWMATHIGAGPYISRSARQMAVLREAKTVWPQCKMEFQDKMRRLLGDPSKAGAESFTEHEALVLRCLQIYADDHYMNALPGRNSFRALAEEAFMGLAIVDTQAEARLLLRRLRFRVEEDGMLSRPVHNSLVFHAVDRFASESEGVNGVDGETHSHAPVVDTVNRATRNQARNQTHNQTRLQVEERRDFGALPVWIVDPPGTVEVDDGVSVEQIDADSVWLHVHVADPSPLVSPDSAMECRARERAQTIHLPELTVPMLPRDVTAHASLHPETVEMKALTFSCRVSLATGDISMRRIEPSILRNMRQLSYEAVDEALSGANPESLQLLLLQRTALAHLRHRQRHGALSVSFPRGRATLAADGTISVTCDEAPAGSARHVISEAMIVAGRVAAEELQMRDTPAPFRYHTGLVSDVDVKVRGLLSRDSATLSLLERYSLIRSLTPAAVDICPRPHVSMGLSAYVKVTSPLRRYLDLVTHRIIREGTSGYGREFFMRHLPAVYRQEQYARRLSQAANRFWIDRWLRASPDTEQFTLHLLERLPAGPRLPHGAFLAHVEQVATNFAVQLEGGIVPEVGEAVIGRLVNRTVPVLAFERA